MLNHHNKCRSSKISLMYKTSIKHISAISQPFHTNFISDQSARIDLQLYGNYLKNWEIRVLTSWRAEQWNLVIQGLAIVQIHSWSLVMKLDEGIEAWNNLDLAQIWTSILVFLSLHHTNLVQMLQLRAWSTPNQCHRTRICKKIAILCGRILNFNGEKNLEEKSFRSEDHDSN